MKRGLRINRIWAFTTIDPQDDSEGIIGEATPVGWLPFIGADEDRIRQLRPRAELIAKITGQKVMLSQYTVRTDLEVINP